MTTRKQVVFLKPSPSVPAEWSKTAQTGELARNPHIPVLTDILQSPERKRPPAPSKPSPPATVSPDELPWEELEERLTGRIRKQVMERLNFVLDDNVSQHVSTVLEQMATMIAEEIKYDMQNTLEVIVTHTISTELQRLRQNERQLENDNAPSET